MAEKSLSELAAELRAQALATQAEIEQQERQERLQARKLRMLQFAKVALPALAAAFFSYRAGPSHDPNGRLDPLGPGDVLFRDVKDVWRCANGRFIINP